MECLAWNRWIDSCGRRWSSYKCPQPAITRKMSSSTLSYKIRSNFNFSKPHILTARFSTKRDATDNCPTQQFTLTLG